MSIFTKPISQLTPADLQELLQEKAIENVRLEFKREIPDKDSTLKKLSSFANTFGGFMIIGASANSADGRIEDLCGVEVQNSYKQRVIDWCYGGASPPLTVAISDPILVSPHNEKVCYVIYAPESDVAPHFLNGRKGVWVRADEFSARFEARLANENELCHLLDRRKVVLDRRSSLLERAKKRFDTFAAKGHTDRAGNRTKMGPILELSVTPCFPSRPVCEHGVLKSLIVKNVMQYGRMGFPILSSDNIISQYESVMVLAPMRGLSLFEANVWGMFFYCTQIGEEHEGISGINRARFVGSVLLFVRHAGMMLKTVGYFGSILVKIELRSVLGVSWFYDAGGWMEPTSGSELDDDISFPITTTSEALIEKPDSVSMDILRFALYSINAPALVENPNTFNAVIQRGYNYNLWLPPNNL